MFWGKVLFLAIIGAVIGWMTNVLAIKLIFRPFTPFCLPIINFRIQGLIPKRKDELAKSIGQTIENELISMEEIMDRVIHKDIKDDMIREIKVKIKAILDENLPSLIPATFKNMITSYVDELIDREGDNALNELSEKLIYKATSQIKISEIIEEKVNEFEMEKLEEIILKIAKRELKHIELLGAVIGFVIGLFQGLIVLQF